MFVNIAVKAVDFVHDQALVGWLCVGISCLWDRGGPALIQHVASGCLNLFSTVTLHQKKVWFRTLHKGLHL